MKPTDIHMTKENVKPLLETKFIKVFDLQYAEGRHYYDATRHTADTLTALQSDDAFRASLPDAVSCFVILTEDGEKPRLLLFREYRYPAGRFLLSPPAGLIDAEDRDKPRTEALLATAKREIHEETGLTVSDGDRLFVVSPYLFSTPGMTDESNGLVCAVLRNPDLSALSDAGAVGGECFDGFRLYTEADARRILGGGHDDDGNFYSVYTWCALMYFCTGLWKTEE